MNEHHYGLPEKSEPTKAEIDILTVLWRHGPSTVRFVHDQLIQFKEVNYTTTLKQMQLMAERGFLKRDESSMKHVYEAKEEERKTKGVLLNRFVDHLYGGSVGSLVMQLLNNKKPSKEELDAIRTVLDQLDSEKE